MNKLMNRFVATRKKQKRNRPVFRHGMPLQGIPRKNKMPILAFTRDEFILIVCFADL